MVTELCIFTVRIWIRIITNTVCLSLLVQLCYAYIDILTTDCYYVNIHETRLYKGCSENITYVSKVVPLSVRNKVTMDVFWILYTWVCAPWIEFNNCPTRCDLFSLLYFCRQLCMFRVLTPIIRSSYNCNCSFWYWLTAMNKICCYWYLVTFSCITSGADLIVLLSHYFST